MTSIGGPSTVGQDGRSVTVVDGSPKIVTSVVTGGRVFRVSAKIIATAFTSGLATYTVAWTENGVSQSIVVTASVLNTISTSNSLAHPDAGTNITAQLTGVFVGTMKVSASVEELG